MEIHNSDVEVPTWVIGLIILLIGASFVYGIIVIQSLTAPLVFWLGVTSLGVFLFVVYLLYRLVIAIENIADKI